MPRHFTEKEKELIRDRFLDVGLMMFERYGIDKTNIEDITREVGVSKGSFYSFYKSKGDLFIRVYQRERTKAHELFRKKYDSKGPETDIEELIMGYAHDMRDILLSRPILNIMYKLKGLDLISEEEARESLMDYNIKMNRDMSDMIQGWLDKRGNYKLRGRIVAEMLRSLNFLRWHDYAIGLDIFDEVIETLTRSIVLIIKDSKEQ